MTNDTATAEQTTSNTDGYLSPEFISSKESCWMVRDGRPVLIVCGDDRDTDEASAMDLIAREPGIVSPNEGGLSLFGQVAGLAKNVLVTGIAQYGEDFYDKVGGFQSVFNAATRAMASDTGAIAVRPAQHSDGNKEAAAHGTTDSTEPVTFCSHGDAALGCAYCMGAGPVSALVAEDDLVFTVGKNNIEHVFGETDDPDSLALRDAQRYILQRIGKDFAFGRQDYIASGLPVQILRAVPHMAASKTGFIVNLDPNTVGQAGDVYRGDVAGVALEVRRIFKDWDLDPKLLIKSQILEAAAVRAALVSGDVSGDTTPDPRRLAFGVRGGTIQSALAEISRFESAA